MPSKSLLILSALLVVVLLAACAARPVPESQPTGAALLAGKGGVRGQSTEAGGLWPQANVIYAFAAPFSGDAAGNGVYLLDPGMDPRAELDAGGYFQLNNLTPGRYVLVVGPTAENSRPLLNERQHTLVVQVEAGGWVELGPVELAQ